MPARPESPRRLEERCDEGDDDVDDLLLLLRRQSVERRQGPAGDHLELEPGSLVRGESGDRRVDALLRATAVVVLVGVPGAVQEHEACPVEVREGSGDATRGRTGPEEA